MVLADVSCNLWELLIAVPSITTETTLVINSPLISTLFGMKVVSYLVKQLMRYISDLKVLNTVTNQHLYFVYFAYQNLLVAIKL